VFSSGLPAGCIFPEPTNMAVQPSHVLGYQICGRKIVAFTAASDPSFVNQQRRRSLAIDRCGILLVLGFVNEANCGRIDQPIDYVPTR
jgi:hypothetical protein